MVLEKFCEKHKGFIESCAARVAAIYDFDGIFGDLASAGMIAVLEQIDRYDRRDWRGVSD